MDLSKDSERAVLSAMLGAIFPFRQLRATMPLQYVTTFLLVALDEGKNVSEYASKAGVAKSVMSRHLLDIGERNRDLEPGFGLVKSEPNPLNLREHRVTLTDKGRQVATHIRDQLVLARSIAALRDVAAG